MNCFKIAAILLLIFPCIVLGQSSAGNDRLTEQVIQLWPIENSAIAVLQKTGAEVIRNAKLSLNGRFTPQEQDVVMEKVIADVDLYLDKTTPLVLSRAESVKPGVLLPFLQENFDQDELVELISIMESPVRSKFQKLLPDIQSQYMKDVVTQSSELVKPELESLMKNVNATLTDAVSAR